MQFNNYSNCTATIKYTNHIGRQQNIRGQRKHLPYKNLVFTTEMCLVIHTSIVDSDDCAPTCTFEQV